MFLHSLEPVHKSDDLRIICLTCERAHSDSEFLVGLLGQNIIRVYGDIFDPWFLALDVCILLGFSNISRTCSMFSADAKKYISVKRNKNYKQHIVINSEALLQLIELSPTSRVRSSSLLKNWYHLHFQQDKLTLIKNYLPMVPLENYQIDAHTFDLYLPFYQLIIEKKRSSEKEEFLLKHFVGTVIYVGEIIETINCILGFINRANERKYWEEISKILGRQITGVDSPSARLGLIVELQEHLHSDWLVNYLTRNFT